jgi:hypothetical protein
MESLALIAFLTCTAFPVVYLLLAVQHHIGDALAWRATPAPYREDQRSYRAHQGMPAMAYLDGKTSLAEAQRRAMME